MKFNIMEIITTSGFLYIKQNIEEVNGISFPSKELNDCFTGEECEFYYNYLYFKRLDKCLEYGDLIIDDEVLSINPISIRQLSVEQYAKILLNKRPKGANLYEEVQNIINKGISKQEADKILKEKTKNEIEEQEEQYDSTLDTFFKVFGDLFEDNIPTR